MSDPYSKGIEAFKKGEAKKAINNFKKAVNIASKLGKNKIKAQILENLAFAYVMNSQYTEGIKALKDAVLIFSKFKMDYKVIECLAYIGALYLKINNIELALKYYKEAQKIIREKRLYSQCRKIEADICSDLGTIFDKEQKYIQSLENYNRALKLYKKLGDKYSENAIYLDIGLMYFHKGSYDEASINVLKALKGYKEFNNINGQAECHIMLGNIYQEQNKWNSSLKEYQTALKYYTSLNEQIGVAKSKMGIGICLSHLNNNKEALDYLIDASNIFKKLKNEELEALCYAWIGKIKQKLGDSNYKKYKDIALSKLTKLNKKNFLSKIK